MTNALRSSALRSRIRTGAFRFLCRQSDASRRSIFLLAQAIAKAFRPGLVTALLSAWVLSGPTSVALGGEEAHLGQQGAAPSSASDNRVLSVIDQLVDAGDLTAARRMLAEEVSSRGESYQTIFLEAKLLFREKRHRESLRVLERVLALNQHDVEAYKLVASNAILLNRVDIAEQALKSATQLLPNDYLVFFHLGALYYTDSRFPSAQPMLEKSVSLNPDYVPAQLFLGLTLEELAQEASAMDCYHRAIELAERSGFKGEQPYLYPGRLLYRQNKREESLAYLQKAAKANPQSCETLCLLARIHATQGRETDAVTALNQCVQADPGYSEAHYLLSRAYVKQGRTEEAAKELVLFQELRKLEQNRKDPRKNQRANP